MSGPAELTAAIRAGGSLISENLMVLVPVPKLTTFAGVRLGMAVFRLDERTALSSD